MNSLVENILSKKEISKGQVAIDVLKINTTGSKLFGVMNIKFRSHKSFRSGTILKGSNLSFLIWYKTLFLLSVNKKVFLARKFSANYA